MARARHYSKATLLWKNVAYCDQWEKVMVVYDERNNLRAVVKVADEEDTYYNVLLVGDDDQALYELNGIELGSTGKNMKACFEIHLRLRGEDMPSYVPSYRKTMQVELYRIFPHTRVGARRTGGFRTATDDIGDKIAYALERYDEIVKGGVKTYDCFEREDDEGDRYSGYPKTIYGYAGKKYHIGNGAYSDDNGDNWDFR